ncbi:MAG: hypothetical protein DMG36_09665 [Acidobacteria bacterium]|nr:MAG: hypothetical protein DMG36_09665 [Acidobacteriota bacterium]
MPDFGSAGFSCAQATPAASKLIAKNANENLKFLMVVLQTVRDPAPTPLHDSAEDVSTSCRGCHFGWSGILWEKGYNLGA